MYSFFIDFHKALDKVARDSYFLKVATAWHETNALYKLAKNRHGRYWRQMPYQTPLHAKLV